MTPAKQNKISPQIFRLPLRVLCLLCVSALWVVDCRACAAPAADFTLPNGLRILVRERHASPLIAIELWVRAGAREETSSEAGAAHFLEHTLFKGTKTRRVGEVDMAIENLGATLNAATGPDYARFYTCVASEHGSDALEVVADVVRNAALPALEVERERQVIRDELAQRDSDSGSVLIDRLYGAAFSAHPYGRPPGGTAAGIRALTRESLVSFYRRTYTPGRCTLVLAGDLTSERARSMAERAFGDWPATKSDTDAPSGVQDRPDSIRAHEKISAPRPSTDSTAGKAAGVVGEAGAGPDSAALEARDLREVADIAYPAMGIAFLAPAAADKSMACAAQVVAAILGQSDIGGRLSIGRLSGCGARVSFAPRRDSGLFIVASTMPLATFGRMRTRDEMAAATAAQQQAVLTVLQSLHSTPPTAGELLAAKSALLGRMIFENETNTGLASALGGADVTGGDPPEAWRAGVEKITLAEVRQFAARWLDSAHSIRLILLPRSLSTTTGGQP